MSTLNFNATEVEPSAGFDVIPAGKYNAVISDSEMKDTRSGTGRYLQLEFEIIDGEFKNRKLWARLNLENPNPDAVRMDVRSLGHLPRGQRATQRVSLELLICRWSYTVRCMKNHAMK
jgi:hypothetical protein